MGLVAAGGVLLSSALARAQAGPPAPRDPEPAGGVAEEPATPEVDVDGTERHEWWRISPNLRLRLDTETGRDERLRQWPENLVEGPRTTAAVFELRHQVGRLTLEVGLGLGVTTTRTGGPATLTWVEREQQLTGVATLRATLQLPRRWKLGLGATATGGDVKVGVTVEKDF